jgi:CRP-like cAMP-binding protein
MFKFQFIAKDVGSAKIDKHILFLRKVELLSPLAEYERAKLAEALEEKVMPAGTVIVRQGEVGSDMYILAQGSCVVTQRAPNEKEEKELVTYSPGDYFGERALMEREPRAATVTVTQDGHAVLLKISRDAFSLLLGPLEAIFKKRIESYQSKPKRVREWKPLNVAKSQLQYIGTLGKGSYGFVTLVENKETGDQYALKAVSKYEVVKTNQVEHILCEKQVMCELRHPCLVNLLTTYNEKDQIFFLMEVGMGGDLFTIHRENRRFTEDEQVLFCFRHCGF